MDEPAKDDTAKDGLLSMLLDRYDLRDRRPAIVHLVSGRNEIYRIETDTNELILKVGHGISGRAAMQREARTLAVLAATTARVPRLVATKSGDTCVLSAEGYSAFICEAIRGAAAEETERGFARYGDALARLHRALDELPVADQMSFPRFDPISVVAHAAEILRGRPFEPEHADRLAMLRDFVIRQLMDTHALWEQDALGHGDAHVLNLLFADARESGRWIDWEDAYRGPLAYDLATLVWSTFRQRRTRPLWAAGLEAYARVAVLSGEQLQCLGVFVAVRHLWWLGLHAEHWGQYAMHVNQDEFFTEGTNLLEIICHDACGMPSRAARA